MKKPFFCTLKLTIILIIANFSFATYILADDEFVNIVSARQEYLIKPIFEEFTKDTGIKVNYEISFDYTNNDTLSSIRQAGEDNPIDAYLVSDASDLYKLQQNALLQPIRSKILQRNIPSHLKDPSKQWFGLSMRVRSIVYHTSRVDPSKLIDYTSIGDERWFNKLSLRTSQKIYNKSMVAIMIAHYGYDKTKEIVASWVKNFSLKPMSNDIEVINAIVDAKADIGIVNSYYLAKMIKENPSLPVKMHFIGDEKGRVHINISGMGVARYAKRKDNAIKLIEWLSSKKGQRLFSNIDMEYPVNKRVKPHRILQSWGKFKQMKINVKKAGELRELAIKLMKEVEYE
ncbi:extracellular solute-binding protein [Sulfurimonas sp.]|uniref:extracellular solute-binding protein n=1 Tax=Sulfurimonas sp. TaxID=2022749 RepID=UPI0025D96412|nr:extracellular solute-binding protein [Sulfurimonas sp.]